MKQRYAVGYYNNEERLNDPEWMESPHCRLVTFIYDNQDMFNIRYITHSEDKNRAWIVLDTKELLKAKKHFSSEETTKINDFIDLCQEYDKWQTSCDCCDSITLNTLPYTYRGDMCIGRVYNCPMCSGLSDRVAYKLSHIRYEKGTEEAINTIIAMDKGEYIDEDAHKYCSRCDHEHLYSGIVKDGKEIIFIGRDGEGFEIMSIEKYNELQEELEERGGEPYYYPSFDLKGETDGYRCINCNTKLEEDKIKKLGLSL